MLTCRRKGLHTSRKGIVYICWPRIPDHICAAAAEGEETNHKHSVFTHTSREETNHTTPGLVVPSWKLIAPPPPVHLATAISAFILVDTNLLPAVGWNVLLGKIDLFCDSQRVWTLKLLETLVVLPFVLRNRS